MPIVKYETRNVKKTMPSLLFSDIAQPVPQNSSQNMGTTELGYNFSPKSTIFVLMVFGTQEVCVKSQDGTNSLQDMDNTVVWQPS